MRKDLFLLGLHIGLYLGFEHGRKDHDRSHDYLSVRLGSQENHRMIKLKPGLVGQPINITLHKSDGTKEDRSPTISNVVATVSPVTGTVFPNFTAPQADGTGGSFDTGTNLGDQANFNLTAHVAFPDGEEYDVALKDAEGNVGQPELVQLSDDEAGDTLSVTLGVVPV